MFASCFLEDIDRLWKLKKNSLDGSHWFSGVRCLYYGCSILTLLKIEDGSRSGDQQKFATLSPIFRSRSDNVLPSRVELYNNVLRKGLEWSRTHLIGKTLAENQI